MENWRCTRVLVRQVVGVGVPDLVDVLDIFISSAPGQGNGQAGGHGSGS